VRVAVSKGLQNSELIVRLIKLFVAVAVLVAFASCTDSPITFWGDLDPPYGGWLWVVETDYGELKKVRPSDGEVIESYVTPFDSNCSYEAAAGDSRVWVGGFPVAQELFSRFRNPLVTALTPLGHARPYLVNQLVLFLAVLRPLGFEGALRALLLRPGDRYEIRAYAPGFD